jgi:hypothetical protein
VTLRAFFATEATECLERIERAAAESDRSDSVGIERAFRALAGLARLGEHPRLYSAATTVVTALRNDANVPDDMLRETMADLHALLAETEPADALDARLLALKARWGAIDGDAEGSSAAADPEFFAWVGDETAAIAEGMDRAVEAFAEDATDREELGAILRRQRPLLGAARLSEIAIVGETLHAVEDLSALIVRLDVPIKTEWLDVFRCARDVLRAAALRLEQGEQPEPVNALSRLRTLRHELMDRYEARIASTAASPASADEEAVPLMPASYTPVTSDSDAVVEGVSESSETGPGPEQEQTPLERAMELRPVIDAGADRAARTAVAELYQILRQSLS